MACDRSFAIAPFQASLRDRARAAFAAFAPATRPESNLAPTEVGLAASGLAGLAATALFYAIVVSPLEGTYFGALFADRGWVPYVIALMAAWSAVILVMKYRLVNRQESAFTIDLLPTSVGERIELANVEAFIRHVDSQAESAPPSFLPLRLTRALQYFRARGSVREVVDQLGQQALSDSEAVDASYTLVRTFIWAIPILGFIGTVLGIGAAVSGFSESVAAAADLNLMKQSIGSVTTGLGVAFDTTLLALVMSILVMFPASWLQKTERSVLTRVDDYCEEHLIRRLVQAGGDEHGPETAAMTQGLRELRSEFERLTKTIGALDGRLGRIGRD
jgi:biopolymer transport protein ExbB/TolQ